MIVEGLLRALYTSVGCLTCLRETRWQNYHLLALLEKTRASEHEFTPGVYMLIEFGREHVLG